MKVKAIIILLFLALASNTALPQGELPREYVPEKELVVLSSGLEMKDALDVLSEYAIEFAQKPIFDPLKSQGQIGIDIKSLPWRKALELILSKHGLWYAEREHFFEIIRPSKAKGQGAVEGMDFIELDSGKEIRLGVREVKIEAIFFQANRKKLFEWGIDWSTFSNGTIEVRADQFGTLPLSEDMLNVLVSVPHSIAKVDVTALLRSFDSSNIGEVIAQPQVVVTEGQEGTIQVGQDFSIKTRDFAGNIIDRFFSTGTILKVTPYVLEENNKSYIFLQIHVERSTAHPDVVSTIIKKSEANSFVELFDGEQTLIAGLYSNETNRLRKGVPYLKDLPWWFFGMRYLFGFFRDEAVQMELVILLKASLLPDVRHRHQASSSSSIEDFKSAPPNIKDTKSLIKEPREAIRNENKAVVKKYASAPSSAEIKKIKKKAKEALPKVDSHEMVENFRKGIINLIRKNIALVDMGEGFEAKKVVGKELIVFRKNGNDHQTNRVGKLQIIKANKQLAAGHILQEFNNGRIQKGDFVYAVLK